MCLSSTLCVYIFLHCRKKGGKNPEYRGFASASCMWLLIKVLTASLTNNHFFSSAEGVLVAVQRTTAFTRKTINLVLRLMCCFYNKANFISGGRRIIPQAKALA